MYSLFNVLLGVGAAVFGVFFLDFLIGTDFFASITHKVWGKFEDRSELKKFAKLAMVFFFVICVYWGLRPLKDGIFASVVGVDYQPFAKIMSPFVVAPLVVLDCYPVLVAAVPALAAPLAALDCYPAPVSVVLAPVAVVPAPLSVTCTISLVKSVSSMNWETSISRESS